MAYVVSASSTVTPNPAITSHIKQRPRQKRGLSLFSSKTRKRSRTKFPELGKKPVSPYYGFHSTKEREAGAIATAMKRSEMAMFKKTHTLFRPPGEADSLIIRVADGCPWNGCKFCGMYKGVKYNFQGLEKAEREISKHWKSWPDARRIFLADGDVMHLDFQTLEKMLISLNEKFSRLARIGVYANGASILAKSDAELRRLKELKLNTLYMGLESGDEQTLKEMNKQESAENMIEAGQRAQAAGLRMSVMVLIGLAGKERSLEHARETADVLNEMQPRLLSALRLVTVPGTPLYDGRDGSPSRPSIDNEQDQRPARRSGPTFKMVTEFEAVTETREMISHLELESTVFRADHSSNIVPLEARFPKDKERLLNQLDALLASGQLDETSPGPLPWSL